AMADSSETRDTGSGMSGKPGTAYDPEKLGEPGQPGVPMGDQHPTNERDDKEEIVADVHIPGPYPSAEGDPTGEPLSSEPEPTKETRDAGSLGDLVHGSDTPATAGMTGSPSGPIYEHDPESPEGKIERARAESFPGGVPEDADRGTGRNKGQGLPPGSVGRGHDTPQTPAT
ncbi:MAG TPA: hypothetical protein VGJ13_00725, partial [Pseudonocardiaceae bacterium]